MKQSTSIAAQLQTRASDSYELTNEESLTEILHFVSESRTAVRWKVRESEWADGSLRFDGERLVIVTEFGMAQSGGVELSFGFCGVLVFLRARGRRSSPSCVLLDGKPRAFVHNQRSTSRVSVGGPDAHVTWFDRSIAGGVTRRARVMDFSRSGLRLNYEGPIDHIPARRFPVQLSFEGKTIRRPAVVRRMEVLGDGTADVGLELQIRGIDNALNEQYEAMSFPQVRPRHTVPQEQVADLFGSSGYTALRSGCALSQAWMDLDDEYVTKDVVYVDSAESAVGHVSITRAYQNTWLGHQIAMRSDHPDTVACRKLLYFYFTVMPRMLDGAAANLIGYYNRAKKWHQIYFEEFLRSVDPELATLVLFDRFENEEPSGDPMPSIASDVRITIDDPSDFHEATATVRRYFPGWVAEALDIDPKRLASGQLCDAYRGSSLYRRRSLLVARTGGRVCAVVLCEEGSRELSLFNVLNMAQIYVGQTPISAEVQRDIQIAIRNFYRERGIFDPLVVAPADTFDGAALSGVKKLETMGCIIWSGEGLRLYEAFLRLQFWRYETYDQSRQRLSGPTSGVTRA